MPRKPFFTQADRMQKIPPFIFGELDRKKAKYKPEELIDLGAAIPDIDPPREVRDEIAAWISSQADFYKVNSKVKEELKKQFAEWFGGRYQVELDPQKEILLLPGQREGINLATLGLVNRGEKVLICDPAFPIYRSAASLAEAEMVILPLLERNDYLPNLSLGKQTLAKARLLLLNYPHNPTTAAADLNFYQDTVNLAKENKFLIINDAVYNELYYQGFVPPSLLQIKGAKNFVLELHTLQFTYNLFGLPLTFAVGGKELLAYLEEIRFNFYSPVADYVYQAGMAALRCYEAWVENLRRLYHQRKELVLSEIHDLGWRAKKPAATHFVWMEVPRRYSSLGFCSMLLRKTGVSFVPGSWFGENGEGWVRISLCQPEERIREAFQRIREHLPLFKRKYKKED
jgi:LL-diaminopimelate aminotransferase